MDGFVATRQDSSKLSGSVKILVSVEQELRLVLLPSPRLVTILDTPHTYELSLVPGPLKP